MLVRAAASLRDVFGKMLGNHLAPRIGQREVTAEIGPALGLVALLDQVQVRALSVGEEKRHKPEIDPRREI